MLHENIPTTETLVKQNSDFTISEINIDKEKQAEQKKQDDFQIGSVDNKEEQIHKPYFSARGGRGR